MQSQEKKNEDDITGALLRGLDKHHITEHGVVSKNICEDQLIRLFSVHQKLSGEVIIITRRRDAFQLSNE